MSIGLVVVRSAEPADLTADRVKHLLSRSWRVEVDRVTYAAVGHGSYHWIAYRGNTPTWFVTGDRIAGKRLTELDASARLAAALTDAGFAFVVAPVPDKAGQLVHIVEPDWAVQVLPYVSGSSSNQGEWSGSNWADPIEQTRVAGMVGRLHAQPAPEFVPPWDPTPPHWAKLNAALHVVGVKPSSRPGFSQRTHATLCEHRGRILALIDRYHLLVREANSDRNSWVLTHGEPDSDNVIRTGDGRLFLIDWTTAAVAPRERDLFDVMQGPEDITLAYQEAAGPHPPRPRALEMIGLHWRLSHLGHDLDLLLHPDGEPPERIERAWERFLERLETPPGTYSFH